MFSSLNEIPRKQHILRLRVHNAMLCDAVFMAHRIMLLFLDRALPSHIAI